MGCKVGFQLMTNQGIMSCFFIMTVEKELHLSLWYLNILLFINAIFTTEMFNFQNKYDY